MKAIKYLVIGGAIVLTGKYLLSLNRAQKKIVIVATGKRGKISTQGISIVISYNIKNPTKASMRMTPPLIKLSLNGTLIGTSNMQMNDIPADVRDKTGKIIIRAFNETGNIEANVFIPWLNLVTVGGDLIRRFKSTDPKDQIIVKVETISQVYSAIGNFPHEETLSIKL